MRRVLTIALFVAGVWGGLWSQTPSFTASASTLTVASGQQFSVTFTFTGKSLPDSKDFKAPDFGQFVVMSGPNSSTSIQWINGRQTASLGFSYYLYARSAGKFTIGSAQIDYDGSIYKTEPISVEVTKGQAQTSSNPQTPAVQDPSLANIKENLFIRAIPTKRRVMQGEQLTLVYKLYTRVGISQFAFTRVPTYEGFWSEEFELPSQWQVSDETLDGKQYKVAIIRKVALFATQSGSLKLAPLIAKAGVQIRSNRRPNDPFDVFNDPFFTRYQTVEQEVESNALTIEVEPFPSGAPASFTGAAGRFSFSAKLDKTEVKAGEPLTLTVTVSGSGNVKLIGLPKPVLPADFEAYEPKISENITREGETIRGSKTAEYLMIPRNVGTRVIEPLSWSYYDLAQNRYVSFSSPRFNFTITPGKEISGSTVSSLSKEDVRLLGEDIRFLKLDVGNVEPIGRKPYENFGFLLALILPPLAFVGAFAYRKRMEKITGNLSSWKSRKAGKEAAKRLKMAKKILASGNTESYHAEIAKALFGYLSDKLKIPQGSLSLDRTLAELTQRNVPADTIRLVRTTIERAEFARFAPATDTKTARQDLLDRASEAIEGLEETVRD